MHNLPEELATKIKNWENTGTPCGAEVIGSQQREVAKVYIKQYSKKQRLLRAAITFFAFLSMAVLSVFIPILHFLLVPLLLLAAFIFPFIAYSKCSTVLGGYSHCPYCGEVFEIAAANDRWPLKDVCSRCYRHVRIENKQHDKATT